MASLEPSRSSVAGGNQDSRESRVLAGSGPGKAQGHPVPCSWATRSYWSLPSSARLLLDPAAGLAVLRSSEGREAEEPVALLNAGLCLHRQMVYTGWSTETVYTGRSTETVYTGQSIQYGLQRQSTRTVYTGQSTQTVYRGDQLPRNRLFSAIPTE